MKIKKILIYCFVFLCLTNIIYLENSIVFSCNVENYETQSKTEKEHNTGSQNNIDITNKYHKINISKFSIPKKIDIYLPIKKKITYKYFRIGNHIFRTGIIRINA